MPSDEMIIDYAQYYDEKYFTGAKIYVDANGTPKLYHGPSLIWDGFDLIARTLAPMIPGKTILDIGCSGGDLVRRVAKYGNMEPYGVEISTYAIDHCVPEMKRRISCADITSCPEILMEGGVLHPGDPPVDFFPNQFDAVIATDLMEHIYEEDLGRTFDWMISKTNRWLFFCIATAQAADSPFYKPDKIEFVAKKGQPIPAEWRETAAAGHVNVRHWSYWVKFFRAKGLTIRWDLGYLFQMQREMNEPWQKTGGWNMGCTFFCEKK